MKRYKKIILNTASLIPTKHAIPAKAGIQENNGFPRVKHKAGLVKPGMTNRLTFISSCMVLNLTVIFISIGIALTDPIKAHGQPKGKGALSQERGRDPFLLPPGIHLLSNKEATTGTKNISSKLPSNLNDGNPLPLKVKAILISDHIRLALIDRHIVTVGDSIQDEKVLDIAKDRVILGKKDQTRTLLLSQSPILLTVGEKKGEQR
ncbi:MAG: hypothetical protein HXY44_14430 [Syntrophaceae bacterium]|nr:hypothetical protein [Syntrophaceae bacterium]